MGLFPLMISFLRLHRSKREERREGGKTRQGAGIHRKNVQGAFHGKDWLVQNIAFLYLSLVSPSHLLKPVIICPAHKGIV